MMPPKAYRWVGEMEEVAETFSTQVGFEKDIFHGIAEVFKVICGDTILGQERTERRQRGQTVDDVTGLMLEGMIARRKVSDESKREDPVTGGASGLEGGVLGLKVDEGQAKEKADQEAAV